MTLNLIQDKSSFQQLGQPELVLRERYFIENVTPVLNRPSNRIDIEYLLYLPFCEVFVSADRLHDQLAPLLARDDQSIVKHDCFRADLQRRLAERDALDAEARSRREFAFGSYPWPLKGSALTDLWRKHHGPWPGRGNRAVRLSAAEQERALAEARVLVAASE